MSAPSKSKQAGPGWAKEFRELVHSIAGMIRQRGVETVRYLMTTEVHTYAFSVAANVILAFFPFMVLLMTLVRHVIRSTAMYEAIVQVLQNYLPAGQDFIVRNLNVLVNTRRGTQALSLVMLLVTSSGVFLPLEVALNKVWGIEHNRSYWRNQLVSLGLAFAVGVLALGSVALTAGNRALLQAVISGDLPNALTYTVMKASAFLLTVSIFFLIYWLLPNGHIPARAVLPAAVSSGLIWEGAKYLYILALPFLDFKEVYGPFAISVSLMFWAFLLGMVLLGGAHLSANGEAAKQR